MLRQRGSILLSVMAFLLIFGAFESFRYHNFVQRQELYRYMLIEYRKPPIQVPVQNNTSQRGKPTKQPIKPPVAAQSVPANKKDL